MTTELPEREFEVASALGAFVAIEHVEQRVIHARGTGA